MRLRSFAANLVALAVARTVASGILGILLIVSLSSAVQSRAQTNSQPPPAYTAIVLNPVGSLGSAGLGAAGGKQAGYAEISGVTRAVTWSGTVASLVVLEQPAGAQWSAAYATSSANQVGGADYPNSGRHAILWSQNGARDLHPGGFSHSVALGTSGSRHVGWGYDAAIGQHALLWEETPLGIVPIDLHPPGVSSSWATATSGDEHVGAVNFEPRVQPEEPPFPVYSYEPWHWRIWWIVGDLTSWLDRMTSVDSRAHAALWQGRDVAAIDLNPAGYQFSVATGVSGGQQVGYGLPPNSYFHAVRWAGTPESAVDLNPPGFYASQALGTNGSRHVGWGYTASEGGIHALVWSEDVALDLHPFLPPGYYYSVATGIDTEGNITGYAGGSDGIQRAFLWKPGAGATPSPVCSLTATPEGKGIRLTWQPPASSGTTAITGYRIYRRDWYSVEHLASVGATTTSFKDHTGTSGGTYYYQVSAINDAGEGAQGSEVSAVVP